MRSIFSRKIATIIIICIVIIAGIFLLLVLNKKEEVKIVPTVVEKIAPGPVEKVIGLSVDGRKIESYTYGTGGKILAFVGGIHGGYEWNSVLLAYKFMDYLKENPTTIPKNISVTVIPSLNPDGIYKVTGKEGRFTVQDVNDNLPNGTGRFNEHNVDLNRNFNCKWQATSTWKDKIVSAGTSAFSEPEALSIQNFALENKPAAVIFWHSQSNAVYGSDCGGGILPETRDLMKSYSQASGYNMADTFSSYVVTGDASDWLASIKIPAISVELKTHETIEWDKNLAGIKALFGYYGNK